MTKPIIFDILAVDEASRTFTKVGLAAQGMGTKVESAGKIASRGFLYAGVAAGAPARALCRRWSADGTSS